MTKESKRKKFYIRVVLLGLAGIVVFACVLSCLMFSLVDTAAEPSTAEAGEEPVIATLTQLPAPTEMLTTQAPTPVPTLEPTAKPAYLTPGDIERHRDSLTDLQRDLYEQEVVGEVVSFGGQVQEVTSNGDVLLDDSGMSFNLVRLQGVPLEVAITLQKDQPFKGLGTVSEVGSGFLGLGMSLDIWVTSWELE